MNRLFKILRGVVALACAVGALAWGWRQLGDTFAVEAWEVTADRRGPGRLANLPEPPPNAASWRRLARILEQDIFPPNYELSAKALERAIVLDPMRSQDWLTLARFRMFSDREQEARAALRRSDLLDPRFPGQRAEAIQLWGVLGDREAAMGVAQGIARIDGEGRRTASRELLLSGFTPDEVFDGLHAESLKGPELAQVLGPLVSRDRAATARLFARIPEASWDDESFARELLPSLVRPIVHQYAMRAWHSGFRESGPVGIPSVGLVNGKLTARPFESLTVLGWQAAPTARNVSTRYRGPDESGFPDRGSLRLAFVDSIANVDELFSWRFYYLPVEAGTSVTLRLKVRSTPAERSVLRFVARTEGRGFGSEPTDWGSADWQDLSVFLPAQERDSVFELSLERQRRGGSDTSRPEVHLAGIEAFLGEAPPP